MTNEFDIRKFLIENKVTEQSKQLAEVKGSETKEGKEIISFFEKELGLGRDGKKYLIKSLDNTNARQFKRAYNYFEVIKNKNDVEPQDIATVNDMLRGTK